MFALITEYGYLTRDIEYSLAAPNPGAHNFTPDVTRARYFHPGERGEALHLGYLAGAHLGTCEFVDVSLRLRQVKCTQVDDSGQVAP